VDHARFPVMRLVQDVLVGEDALSIAFNAANEVANAAFREQRIGFMDIVTTVEQVLGRVDNVPVGSLDEVWLYDGHARKLADEVIAS